ncbi:MAG: hypothetical protein V7K67_25985 [Nostoc sp.]|uniref:hypothetical protein n=1 Tax=Nostoc sp. TaxID=1180 RepID=UPI002FFABCB3
MHTKPKRLGITQLFLSLFSHSLKGIQGTFRNSPSIPPATISVLRLVAGGMEVLDEYSVMYGKFP